MTSLLDGLGRLVSGRLGAVVALVASLLLTAVVMGLGAGVESSGSAPNSLPDDAESARVAELQREFPDGDVLPAIAVVERDGGLTPQDREYVGTLSERWAQEVEGEPSPPVPSEDGEAVIVSIPVSGEVSGLDLGEVVEDLRAAVEDPPEGLTVELTGGAAFAADTASAFEGANLRLLLVTAAVVAVLLVLTYRSPVLWLVPLVVIALADRTAASLTELVASWAGTELDGSTSGITSVLVFGAGTNYALLLVSRYREELRRRPEHREALAAAVRGSAEAILASNLTVVLALLVLLTSVAPNSQSLGVSAAIGLVVALLFALFALPAALSLFGRGLFWPFVPRPGTAEGEGGAWLAIARRVVRRPGTVLVASLVVLGVLATGLLGVRVGLSTADQFRVEAESVDGLETLSEHYPSGASSPVTVIADADRTEQVVATVADVDGVVEARPAGTSGTGLVQVQATLDSAPATDRSIEAIREMRSSLDRVEGADALVGGSVAEDLDARDGAERDLMVVVPLILLVVLVVLLAVLRAVVTPFVLIGINVLSTTAALGAGVWVSEHVFGFPALDVSVPLYVVLFLVALGIDYTVFLVLRAREEAATHGTVEGMVRSVGVTGGVITSAGIVLAAVFAVLGVLPLITLTQVGVIVGLGILLDTFLVRTVVVPAVFALVGDRIWWPARPYGPTRSESVGPEPAESGSVGPAGS